ncbi:MAG: L,D-transpeptidase family protein, partial [Candidatus Omnitrophica bacterium]|nr:L,D-transpeptidase family protein [Candidatus Omnitrophota bacterium]
VVQYGDSLTKIAKKNNTTVSLIKKSNGLTRDTIRAGQHLRLWKGSFSVYVDKSQNTLMLKSDKDIVKVYSVSTGKNNSTPVGTFTIVNKTVNPVWFKGGGQVIPPESPENILGTRWMGFNDPYGAYGIHGTTEPQNIGKQVTAGCVRMRNNDVEELYDLLPEETQVVIVD